MGLDGDDGVERCEHRGGAAVLAGDDGLTLHVGQRSPAVAAAYLMDVGTPDAPRHGSGNSPGDSGGSCGILLHHILLPYAHTALYSRAPIFSLRVQLKVTSFNGGKIMQILVCAILFLGQQGSLDSYNLTIDPVFLDSLYAHPFDDLEFPALIETEAGICSCTAGFRGGTSLWCSKKSWKIELADPSLLNASHLLLDAQYRDLTMMRNALAMWLARRLGRPASETRHVELTVNGEPYGVYVQVEHIDNYFFQRNGIGDGPLFKSVSHEGRLAWQPCDSTLITGFEAKEGSEEAFSLVRRLIDQVNLDHPFQASIPDWIAYTAVTLAINDTDALTKNYYIHMTPEGEWRFYPWDRDASFGNTWTGDYDSSWVHKTTTFALSISPMTARLLTSGENRELLEEYIEELSEIMRLEMPGVIDSIQAEIRESVGADPFYDGNVDDFDEAVAVLRSAVISRGGIPCPGSRRATIPWSPFP